MYKTDFRCQLHQIVSRKTLNIASIASSLLVILTEISSLFQLSSVPTLQGLPFQSRCNLTLGYSCHVIEK
jgi:hypothetical protein